MQKKQISKSRAGQGRAGTKHKAIKPWCSVLDTQIKYPEIITQKHASPILEKQVGTKQIPFIPRTQPKIVYPERYEKPPYIEPYVRPPPKPIRQAIPRTQKKGDNLEQILDVEYLDLELKTDIEETHHSKKKHMKNQFQGQQKKI